MKPITVLSLGAAAILGLGISSSLAGDRSEAQCIKLWPIVGGISSMLPHAPTPQAWQLIGTGTHEIVYVESRDVRGDLTFDPRPKQMFIFPTTSGQYLVRFDDVPADHGWYGPF
jgi:hypothetical protein